jgi:beta-glucosidase
VVARVRNSSSRRRWPKLRWVPGRLDFPPGFLWGTATAAYHVEGDNRNCDWWEFEQQPGRIAGGDRSGIACDSYRRFRDDFDLMQRLHMNVHRLSIEWSRIEPSPGVFDSGQIQHYREVLEALRERGLKSMVTLHHFTSPLWFTRRGGWTSSGSPDAFLPFVRRAASELGDLVDYWCTINEPNLYAYWGWLAGAFPPGRSGDVVGVYRVLGNMRRAHEQAYSAIKAIRPDTPAGLAQARVLMFPDRPGRRLDRWAAGASSVVLDRWPSGARLVPVDEAIGDFIGINHYYGQAVAFDPRAPGQQFIRRSNPSGAEVTEAGFATDPHWMRQVLDDLKPLGRPVFVTESGIATGDDSLRRRYIVEVLEQVHAAIAGGVDVRGYFLFTLLDSFEWAQGYATRFGLVEVDRHTMERRPKPSADLFAKIAAANALTDFPSPHTGGGSGRGA